MKYLLKSSLIALLLLSFSPAARAGFLDSPLYGNYYGTASRGKIKVVEVAVGDSSNEVIGTFFFGGTHGYIDADVSNDGTVSGDYWYYDYASDSYPGGKFTAKINKTGTMICKFSGTISATIVIFKAKGQGPEHLAGKYIHFSGGEFDSFNIKFYLDHAYNYFNEKAERYSYHKTSATTAVLTVGRTSVNLTYTNPDDDGEGTFTGTGPDGSFSGYFDVSDLEEY